MTVFSFAALEHDLHNAEYETVMQTGMARKVEMEDSPRLRSNPNPSVPPFEAPSHHSLNPPEYINAPKSTE
jgi:hypothetical protein